MTCELIDYPMDEQTAPAVVKTGHRLGMERVVIKDPGKVHNHYRPMAEWFDGDEATGSYMWADLLGDAEQNVMGNWVNRWRGRVYYFTDRHTAFAFKMRFG